MRIEKRTMGWLPKASAYDHARQQAEKRRAIAQDYLSQQSTLSSTIFTAKDSAASQMTELVFKSVLQRLGDEAQAKLQKSLPTDLVDNLKADIDSATDTGSEVDTTA